MKNKTQQNRVPLDKPLDFISRQAAIDGKICIQLSNGVEIYDDFAVPVDYLKQLPTADVRENVRGEWKYYKQGGIYKCSQCGVLKMHKDKYCPNCGANMRGEKNET